MRTTENLVRDYRRAGWRILTAGDIASGVSRFLIDGRGVGEDEFWPEGWIVGDILDGHRLLHDWDCARAALIRLLGEHGPFGFGDGIYELAGNGLPRFRRGLDPQSERVPHAPTFVELPR